MQLILFCSISIFVSPTIQFTVQKNWKHSNNVCKSFVDYRTIKTNPNCWYNPDMYLDMPSLISSHGYSLEIREVTTEDGYILSVFRIPKESDAKGVILLMHPAVGIPSMYFAIGNESLGFILSDAGYDVWLGSFRGNYYSQKHMFWSHLEDEFWNYSFHEMGVYDLPAMLNLINEETKQQVVYIGYSMSGTVSAVYASMFPEESAHRLKFVINFAPTVFSDGGLATDFVRKFYIAELSRKLNQLELLPRSRSSFQVVKTLCESFYNSEELCINILMFIFAGWNPEELVPERVPLLLTNSFGSQSLKTFDHLFLQIKDEFRQFDYGPIKNLEVYGKTEPSRYPLEDIKVPFHVMVGSKDLLAPPAAVKRYYDLLPHLEGDELVVANGCNHFDFVYGKNVVTKVYYKILQVLDQY